MKSASDGKDMVQCDEDSQSLPDMLEHSLREKHMYMYMYMYVYEYIVHLQHNRYCKNCYKSLYY